MVYKWDIVIPELTGDAIRQGYLYLPEAYGEDPLRRYPVLYMFDGHNVFFDSDATYGKSWGMKEYMDRTETPLIIVAVECNHEGNGRLSEYSPFDFEESGMGVVEGRGRIYMDWLTGCLKPAIDRNLRTLPDPDHTLICGSSMGGLMALYGVVKYNHVFRKAACLSPSLWVNPEGLKTLISGTRIRKNTLIYMDYGSNELDNHNATSNALISVSRLLLRKRANLTFRIVPGGTHSEASWERQIPVFMACLGL